MNAPDKCPRCGAGPVSGIRFLSDPFEYFTCGTAARDGYTSREDSLCVKNQRDQLAARVKELEEARTRAAANSLATMLACEDAMKRIDELESESDLVMSKAVAWKAFAGRLEAVQTAGIALMNAVAPFSLNPDEEGDDETTIRQCEPHQAIGWEDPPTAREHVKLYDATIAFGRAVFEAKETKP